MKQFDYIIRDPDGISAAPAVLLGKLAKEYTGTTIKVHKDGSFALATKLMALVGLGAKCGDKITVTVEGGDEEGSLKAIEELVNDYL